MTTYRTLQKLDLPSLLHLLDLDLRGLLARRGLRPLLDARPPRLCEPALPLPLLLRQHARVPCLQFHARCRLLSLHRRKLLRLLGRTVAGRLVQGTGRVLLCRDGELPLFFQTSFALPSQYDALPVLLLLPNAIGLCFRMHRFFHLGLLARPR